MKNMIGRCNRTLMLAGCGVLALCLSGCVAASTRYLFWNGLSTREEVLHTLNPKGITSFSEVSYTPRPETPVITIRMPNGKFIPANNLTRDTLAPYVAAGTAVDLKTYVGIDYSPGHVGVWFDEHGNLKRVSVEVDRGYTPGKAQENSPAISTPDGTTILEFPLQEKDLEDLFGAPTGERREAIYAIPPV